ncbi:class I SAM-dependent methyltransferase [Roseiflexus sp.]|uniref:class I SAM-dependent methyltransferase n=1 Tax=Roseiflexus sp. TaxID=2562120 RepID=UPI00398B19A7
MHRDLHEINRRAWNEATRAHNSHKADQARFFRNGGSTLFPEEQELLGDVRGKRLLHLQCNAGQDTLSLAQLGAHVTGVDISDEAIAFARRLSDESGIPATFYRADVYDWLDEAAQRGETFDIVFSSYGFLVWLSDLRSWARGVAAVLAPGGRFVMIEFHPFLMMLDDQGQTIAHSYGGGQIWSFDEGIGDYVAWAGAALAPSGYLEGVQNFRNPHPSHEFSWGIGDLVSTLLDAGLRLETLREYPYANGFPAFEGTVALPGGRFAPPPDRPTMPMMLGLTARRDGV